MRTHPALRVLPVLALVAVAACGSDQDPALDTRGGASDTEETDERGCGPVVVDPLDPTSPQHALPGAAEHEYLTDPPTSGKHVPFTSDHRVLAEPLSEPQQVGLLEAGKVLIQHADVTPAERAELETRAGADVVVAPNPDLPSPIVVTAWIHTMRCSGFDAEAIDSFIAARASQEPGGDHHG